MLQKARFFLASESPGTGIIGSCDVHSPGLAVDDDLIRKAEDAHPGHMLGLGSREPSA